MEQVQLDADRYLGALRTRLAAALDDAARWQALAEQMAARVAELEAAQDGRAVPPPTAGVDDAPADAVPLPNRAARRRR